MGSFTTVCIATPSIAAGRGGSEVPKGVRGLVADSATVRSYSWKPGATGADSFSDDPAALRIEGVPIGNGVLLNDGNCEKAYWAPAVVSVGGPTNGVATPCASSELPCGMFPMRATICDPADADSAG